MKVNVLRDLGTAFGGGETDFRLGRAAGAFIRRMITDLVNIPRHQISVLVLDEQPLVRGRLHQQLDRHDQRLQTGNFHPLGVQHELTVRDNLLLHRDAALHILVLLHQIKQQAEISGFQFLDVNVTPLVRAAPFVALRHTFGFNLANPFDF